MRTLHAVTSVIGKLLGHDIVIRPDPSRRRSDRPGPYYPIPGLPWTAEFIASKEFLQRPEWKRVRYDALKDSDGRCQLCGRTKHELPPGEYLNVDHVKNRRDFPHLALTIGNLEILCGSCNHGRGNRCQRDWRRPRDRGAS
jgi:5-methylcytosine-specific restriction endonuclease McrA